MIKLGRIRKRMSQSSKGKVASVVVEDYHVNPLWVIDAFQTPDKHLGMVHVISINRGNHFNLVMVTKESFDQIIKTKTYVLED